MWSLTSLRVNLRLHWLVQKLLQKSLFRQGRGDAKLSRQHIVMKPLHDRLDPGLEPMALPDLQLDQHNPCRLHEKDAQVAVAAFRYICLGPKPSQAVKSRPLERLSQLLCVPKTQTQT